MFSLVGNSYHLPDPAHGTRKRTKHKQVLELAAGLGFYFSALHPWCAAALTHCGATGLTYRRASAIRFQMTRPQNLSSQLLNKVGSRSLLDPKYDTIEVS